MRGCGVLSWGEHYDDVRPLYVRLKRGTWAKMGTEYSVLFAAPIIIVVQHIAQLHPRKSYYHVVDSTVARFEGG